MKKLKTGYRKGLALVLWIVAAGFCSGCAGHSEGELLIEDAQEELSAQEYAEAAELSLAETALSEYLENGDNLPETSCAAFFVHVCGEVVRPGVYELCEGQRIYEAIELAGGFTEAASESYLNLAELVTDGMKIEVPDKAQAEEWKKVADFSNSNSNQESVKQVNLNTATKEELMTLRGIGEARAEDIIRYREKQGKFQCIEDIMKVSGIKDSAFQKIKEDITVSP